MAEDTKQIGFRGSLAYRMKLKQAALDRGDITVQELIERALDSYLQEKSDTVDSGQENSLRNFRNSDNIHESGIELSHGETEFVRKCLRIFRSQFGKPLQENVTFFEIGLDAVERIAAMRLYDERAHPDVGAPGAAEREVSALLDSSQNEAHLLKKKTNDVIEELRRDRETDPGDRGGTETGRKRSQKKAGGRSGS